MGLKALRIIESSVKFAEKSYGTRLNKLCSVGFGIKPQPIGDIVQINNIESITRKQLPEFTLSKDLEKRLENNTLRQRFIDSFNEFFNSQDLTIRHKKHSLIKQGDMLHGMDYNPKSVHSVLKHGITSGEIGFEGKVVLNEDGILLKGKSAIIPEDCETTGCADFFTSPQNMSIKEYFSSFVKRNFGARKAPEFKYLPKENCFGSGNRQIAYIVDAEKFKSTCPTLWRNSATPRTLEKSPLNGIINHFVDYYDNLKAILVGVPSNCISKVVVGNGLKNEEISYIKRVIKEMKLDIEIYDVLGNLL